MCGEGMCSLAPQWETLLGQEFDQPYFGEIRQAICRDMLNGHKICPDNSAIFRVFRLVDFDNVKIVILGQDPYYAQENQANGLAFAVAPDVALPSSLQNIFKAVERDVGQRPGDRTLLSWAQQGVFLLNTALTTRLGEAYAHGVLWAQFTQRVLVELAQRTDPIVFMLWGSKAKQYRRIIDAKQHLVLEAPHPSGLSAYRGFYDCKHFSRANQFLCDIGKAPIDWGVS